MVIAIALAVLLVVLVAAPWLLVLAGSPLWAPLAIDVGVLSSSAALFAVRWALARPKAKKLEPASAPRPARDALAPDLAAELDELRREVDTAVETIARSQLGGGGRGAIEALPWYAMLGPPGAGKSTLLRGSGLAFPSSPPDASAGTARALAGTRRVDLWLANEAVLFDTAGRWSVSPDGTEWSAFLDLVAKHRGGRGLDGVLVALPIDEVTGGSEAERTALARRLRARVEELVRRFGVSVPVYVLVTRCDRLVGFAESFASLDKRARARPWGVTIERASDIEEVLRAELDELVRSLRARTATVLASERRVEARTLAVELPAHFAAVIDPLVSLLGQVFVASVHGQTPTLRSVHFTSATQEGRASDRLLAAALRASGIEPSPLAEPTLEPRSYFVHQVLTRVAFADAETAAPRTRAKHRRTLAQVSIGVAIAVAAGLCAIGSAFSWRANRHAIDGFAVATRGLPAAGAIALPDTLEALRAALVDLRARHEHPPLSMRFGLLRVGQLSDAALDRYARTMRSAVLAPLLAREATELETWGAGFESDLDREPSASERARALVLLDRQLRFASPMEVGEPPLDEHTRPRVARALAEAWCTAVHRSASECEPHVSLLLEVTGEARPRVQRHDRAIRLARVGLGRANGDHATLDAWVASAAGRGYDLTLARMVGTTGHALSTDRHVRGAFTRRGWEEWIRPRLVAPDVGAGDRWLLGSGASAPVAHGGTLERLYFEAYADEWRSFLSSVRIAAPSDATESLALLEDMTRGTPPPLGRLLVAADDNAHLLRERERERDDATPAETLIDTLSTRLGAATDASTSVPMDAGTQLVADALAPFTHFAVRSAGAPDDAPLGIDVYRDELGLLRDALATYRDDPSTSGALDTRLVAARRRVDGLVGEQPAGARDFFERVLRPPVEGAALTSSRAIAGAVGASFCAAVTTPYARALASHYPFVARGDDAALGEVTAFYRPGGTLWSHYDASLATIAPRSGGHFALAHRDGGSSYASALPTFLERSDAITAGLFPPGSSEPRIEIDVRVHPTAGAASVRLSVGGATVDYRNGPESWTRVTWPGTSPTAGARLEVESARGLSERIVQEGDWGLFRLLEAAVQIESRPGDRTHTARWHLPGHDVDVVVDLRTVRSESVLFDASGRGRVLSPLRAAGTSAPRRIAHGETECRP